VTLTYSVAVLRRMARRVALVSSAVMLPGAAAAQLEVGDSAIASVGTQVGSELGQVWDAAVGPGGDIFVLDFQAKIVLRYAPSGAVRDSIGGPGQGPGEFVQPISIEFAGDTLLVVDAVNRRVSAFGRSGELLAETRMVTPFVVGEASRFSDGRWLLRRQPDFGGDYEGFKRDTVDYFILDATMGAPQLALRAPGIIGARYELDGRVRVRMASYSPEVVATTHGTCGYLTSTDRSEVRAFDSTGESRTILSFDSRPAQPVTMPLKRAYAEWVAGNAPPGYSVSEEEKERMTRTLPFAEILPLGGGILTDPFGLVWVPDYGLGSVSRATTVMSPESGLEIRVTFPKELELLEVGRDYVLAQTEGPLGEPLVEQFSLIRTVASVSPRSSCSG